MKDKQTRKPGRPPKYKDSKMVSIILERETIQDIETLQTALGVDSRGAVVSHLLEQLTPEKEALIAEKIGLERQIAGLEKQLLELRKKDGIDSGFLDAWDLEKLGVEREKVFKMVGDRGPRVFKELVSYAPGRVEALNQHTNHKFNVSEYVGLLDVWGREYDEKEGD